MRTTWKVFSNKTNLIFLLSLVVVFVFYGEDFVYSEKTDAENETCFQVNPKKTHPN